MRGSCRGYARRPRSDSGIVDSGATAAGHARGAMDLARTRTGRRLLFTAYYFVEGAPIGFLWWSLPAILRSRGAEPERIGALLGWLVLPWALKWLWAPLVDRWQGPRWTLRGWIVASQLGMALALLPLVTRTALADSELLVACLCAHAVFAATQDAAIDALMIRTTEPGERGQLAGWMQLGMLTGRSLLGGGALLVLSNVGDRTVVLALLGVVVGGLALAALYRAPIPGEPGAPASDLGARLRAAFRRRTTWLGLAFAALGGAGFEAVGAFASPLLTERAGGATDVAGRFFLLPAVVAMALGGVVGGRVTDRLGARRGTLLAGLLLAATILTTAAAVERSAAVEPLLPWLTAVYAAIGWFTASSYALFMRWTDERVGATQFSAYMAATNLCESWSAAAAGRLIPRAGYGGAFAALGAVGLLALGLVARAGRRERNGG